MSVLVILNLVSLCSGKGARGNYRATVVAQGSTAIQGARLADDVILRFRFLRGDANGDGAVNVGDFNPLAENFRLGFAAQARAFGFLSASTFGRTRIANELEDRPEVR